MTSPNLPNIPSIDELIKRFNERKKEIQALADENQSFDQKAVAHKKNLYAKAKDYIKSVAAAAPAIRIPTKEEVKKVIAFPQLPVLPFGFRVPDLPTPALTNDSGSYMIQLAESTARAAATAIKLQATSVAVKIAAAATFPPTGPAVAAILTIAEQVSEKIITSLISSIAAQLPLVDIESMMQNQTALISQISGDLQQASAAVSAASASAGVAIAAAGAAYTAQKKAMDDATAAAQSTADTAQTTAIAANTTAQQANTTAQSALTTAQSALTTAQAAAAAAAQAAADAAAAMNRPIPTAPPPVTVVITPPPAVTPTPTILPPDILPCPATQLGTETSRTPFDTEFVEVCRWQQNTIAPGGCIEVCSLEAIGTLISITPTPILTFPTATPPPSMANFAVWVDPLLPPDWMTGGTAVADVFGSGTYAIGTEVSPSYTLLRNGWEFAGWYDVNGILLTASPLLTVTIPADGLNVTARFIQVPV